MNGKKTTILFGSSFNPPTTAHFETAAFVHQAFQADEDWMLLSVNPLKDPAKYASLEHRMAMARLVAAHYPDIPFVLSDVEERLGIHTTFDILTALQAEHPDRHFIWTMGMDSFVNFHTWTNPEKIFENFPIAVLRRPPYTEADALACPMAKTYPHLRRTDPSDLTQEGGGWILLDNPLIDMSSHEFLDQVRRGEAISDPVMAEVAAYIRANGILGATPRPVIKPLQPQP
jgi:nicotinate-nucleotide adenylyltransferase